MTKTTRVLACDLEEELIAGKKVYEIDAAGLLGTERNSETVVKFNDIVEDVAR